MFQAILAEERIPFSARVWFARLQMPVLRVAIAEPEFFGTLQHPARMLIDRMGSCVMGFDAAAISGSALEGEIRRVVQVIEQYPETGQRVFKLVFDEFVAFLNKYLTQSDATQRVMSVAQQVEQKETMAIQYTIELRKMLNDMPVREEIREFLFKVWAEVLAIAALRYGAQDEQTVTLKRAASELVWAASAKPNRNDRTRVIQDLPKLLQRLRQGMTLLGIVGEPQEAHIKIIGDTLSDAFMSKTEAIPQAKIEAMAKRLANLEDFVTDEAAPADLPLDAASIELLLGVDAASIEVMPDTRHQGQRRHAGLGARTAGRHLVHARPQRPREPGPVRLAQRPQAAAPVRLDRRPQLPDPGRPAGVLPAGRPAGAGRRRNAHRARHARSAGQAGRQPRAAAELSGRPRAVRSRDQCAMRLRGVVAEFVEHQRIGLDAGAPVHHQHDDLEFVERHRVARRRHGALDHDLAQAAGSTLGGFEKADEAQAFGAEVVLLGARVDAHRVGRLGQRGFVAVPRSVTVAVLPSAWRLELDALGREAQAVEPVQRIADLVGIEAVRAELAAQLLGFGARVAAPVVFVDEHEHFEHGPNIAHERWPRSCATRRCAGQAERDALEQAAGQARDVAVQFEFEQLAPAARPALQPVRALSASRLTGS